MNLQKAMERRFDDSKSGVLEAIQIVRFSMWPSEPEENFGDSWVKTLVDHFAKPLTTLDCDVILIEWDLLKNQVYQRFRKQLDATKLKWSLVNKTLRRDVPNILYLIDLVLTIPASSAECERGFSHIKRIKSTERNNLDESSLSDLLTIKLGRTNP